MSIEAALVHPFDDDAQPDCSKRYPSFSELKINQQQVQIGTPLPDNLWGRRMASLGFVTSEDATYNLDREPQPLPAELKAYADYMPFYKSVRFGRVDFSHGRPRYGFLCLYCKNIFHDGVKGVKQFAHHFSKDGKTCSWCDDPAPANSKQKRRGAKLDNVADDV